LAGTLIDDFAHPAPITIPLDCGRKYRPSALGAELATGTVLWRDGALRPTCLGADFIISHAHMAANLDNKELVAGTTVVPARFLLPGNVLVRRRARRAG